MVTEGPEFDSRLEYSFARLLPHGPLLEYAKKRKLLETRIELVTLCV